MGFPVFVAPCNIGSLLGVPLGNNMKLYTRVTSQEIWTGYWNAVFSILGNYGEFGDCGFELACQLGEAKLAFRKQQRGVWSEWVVII